MEAGEKLHNIRHSLAHLLAMAVLKADPAAKLGVGPVIDNGFYYDFEFSKDFTPSPDDLKAFQKEIKKMIGRGIAFEGKAISKAEAEKMFAQQPYKLELIEDISGEGEELTIYSSDTFSDLCKGGHIKTTKEIDPDAFLITHTAGAYWRGDEKNPMLTRIYGLAFENKDALEAYVAQQEEAKKRDHRKLGKELDLFTFSDLVGPGLPLFTPKGTAMRDAIVGRIYNIQKKFGYQNVTIPHITKKDLYETSGHWQKFGDELFKVKGASDVEFVMKPMNCPHHTQIYASRQRSYRDLPLRYVETTMVYRDEQAGELLGLSRVRSITQDDGHLFCTPEQIEEEVHNIVAIIKEFYEALGMWGVEGSWVSLSVRDPKTPEKYFGDEKNWEKAEAILEKIARQENIPFKRVEGEAAFYGPKLDFMFRDAINRERQLATIQLDFVMPSRFALEYTDSEGNRRTPVMIHRAVAGSLERFLSIIIEHFAGNFPLWLSPTQIQVLPVSEKHSAYAREVHALLCEEGIRAELDESNESLGKRIRAAKIEKIPYILVLGDKEVEARSVTAERRDGVHADAVPIDEFVVEVKKELEGKNVW